MWGQTGRTPVSSRQRTPALPKINMFASFSDSRPSTIATPELIGADLFFERDPTFAKSGQTWGTPELKVGAPLGELCFSVQMSGGWPSHSNFDSWQHPEKGCPTRRGFRRVGTTHLAPLVTSHRLQSPFCDRRGRCRSTCIATTARDVFTSSRPVAISEERC